MRLRAGGSPGPFSWRRTKENAAGTEACGGLASGPGRGPGALQVEGDSGAPSPSGLHGAARATLTWIKSFRRNLLHQRRNHPHQRTAVARLVAFGRHQQFGFAIALHHQIFGRHPEVIRKRQRKAFGAAVR